MSGQPPIDQPPGGEKPEHQSCLQHQRHQPENDARSRHCLNLPERIWSIEHRGRNEIVNASHLFLQAANVRNKRINFRLG